MKPIFSREPAQGLRLFAVAVIAISLMVVDYRHDKFHRLRSAATALAYPLQKVVDTPLAWYEQIRCYFVTQLELVRENQNLKDEQFIIAGRLQKLAALESENSQLRKLLQSGAKSKEDLIVANILRIDPDPFTHQVIINKGKKDKAFVGQPIIDSEGVMGAIINTNRFSSSVMLITDASHAIPVVNVRNNIRAIAIGTGDPNRLELQHVPNTSDIQTGDTFVTSGLGGRFPSGYPVGEVIEVVHNPGKPFASIVLQPSAHLDRSRQVLLVRKKKQLENETG